MYRQNIYSTYNLKDTIHYYKKVEKITILKINITMATMPVNEWIAEDIIRYALA